MNPSDFQRAKRASMIGGTRDSTPSTTLKISSVVGAAIGWGLGAYSGANLMIPLVATGAVFFAAWKLLPEDRRIALPALSVQAGHLLWFVIGMITTKTIGANALDVLWLLTGLIWLAAKPARGPLWVLGIYQLLVLPLNLYLFLHVSVGTLAHKALLVHIVWRVLALGLMGVMYMRLRRKELDGEVPSPEA